MSEKTEYIANRLIVIETLEALEIKLNPVRDSNRSLIGFKFVVNCDTNTMPYKVSQAYNSTYDSCEGKLADAVAKINETIKKEFEPLIQFQKDKIKELLT